MKMVQMKFDCKGATLVLRVHREDAKFEIVKNRCVMAVALVSLRACLTLIVRAARDSSAN